MNDTAIENTIDRSFEVGAEPRLEIHNVAGRITIQVGADATIQVHAEKRGKPDAMENTVIEFEHNGDRLEIRTKSRESGLFGKSHTMSAVDYDIIVPVGCQIDGHVVSGDLQVAGTQAPVSAQAVSGEIDVRQITGDCRVTSVSGSVTVAEVTGTLYAKTVSGDLRIADGNLQNFEVHSVSGNVLVTTPLVSGERYSAHTVSGDLRLQVPGDTGATVRLKTVSGRLRSDLPAQIHQGGRRHWEGTINGGGATVDMHSVSGDLTIELAPGSVAPPAHQQTDADGSATADILDALQRGEIDVNEATARLKAAR